MHLSVVLAQTKQQVHFTHGPDSSASVVTIKCIANSTLELMYRPSGHLPAINTHLINVVMNRCPRTLQ